MFLFSGILNTFRTCIVYRHGLYSMDLEVEKWLRKHASGIRTILVMNKSESLDDDAGYLTVVAGEAHKLGYGDPIVFSIAAEYVNMMVM